MSCSMMATISAGEILRDRLTQVWLIRVNSCRHIFCDLFGGMKEK